MSEIDFKKLKKVYFIGIGGIGISAIARMMVDLGKNVSGSDVQVSRVTEELQKLGVKIYLDHKTNNLPNDVDLVIYTTAISGDNLELIEAKKLGIKTCYAAYGRVTKVKRKSGADFEINDISELPGILK